MPATRAKAITIGEIARFHNEPVHRIEYIINSRQIQPIGTAGRLRIFDDDAVNQVGEILRELDAARGGCVVTTLSDEEGDRPQRLSIPEILLRLDDTLSRMMTALDGLVKQNQRLERQGLRIEEFARSIGVSRRQLERERSAGRVPPADAKIGRMSIWKPSTIDAWLARGGR